MADEPSSIARVVDSVNQFFVARVTGSSASAFRIVLGALSALNALSMLLNTERFFSDAGAYPWDLAGAQKTWGAFAWAPHDIQHSYHVLLAYVLISLLLMVGVFSRLSCAALWYLHLSIIYRNPLIVSGADRIFGMLVFISIFLPISRRWAVDAWVMDRLAARWPAWFDRGKWRLPSIWSARLLQFQVSLSYLITALQKLQEDVWIEGRALRGFLAMPAYATWPAWHDHWPFMKPLTWGTLAFELAFPVLVWFRPFRKWLLIGGIAFHLGIDIMMRIPMFSLIMISSYIMFVPDETSERWMNRFEAWLGRVVRSWRT